MKHTSRPLALLLLFSVLAASACGGTSEVTSDTTASGGDSTSAPTSTEAPSLPDEYDLEGFEFRVIKQDDAKVAWALNTFNVGEENGEVLNDAIFRRNSTVSEKYNFTIVETVLADDPLKTVNQSILAGDDEYDMAMLRGDLRPTNSAASFMNFRDIPNIDLDRPYYDQNLIRDTEINGKLCYINGDILVSDNDSLMMTMYNRSLAEDFGIENLYEVTRTGKWTFELMNKYAKLVSADLDGNDVYDENDRYGLLYVDNNCAQPYFGAANAYLFTKTADGKLEFTGAGERAQSVFETMQSILSDKTSSYNWALIKENTAARIASMIQNKQILFQNMVLSFVRRNFRDIELEFGLLPIPKLDEEQESYISTLVVSMSNVFVPITVSEPDKIGFVIEALSAASGGINTAYYEICLESKYTRDAESVEMIELAMENIVYDLGFIYNWAGLDGKLETAIMNDQGYASLIASLKDTAISEMEKTLEILK